MGAVKAEARTLTDLTSFVQHNAGGSARFEVQVKGARCAGCIAKIESGVKAIPGVTEVRLNLSTGKLHVAWHGASVAPRAILERVRDLGYEAQPFDAGETLNESEREGRFLLRCLALAGFGTVFVMGLTDGIWYGGIDLSPALRQAFFWLAAAVAIPATLYAGRPFFLSAARALSRRTTNMDVTIGAALILALGLSLYETVVGAEQTYFDAAIMLAFLLLIGRYLDYRLRDKAQGAARHLLAMQSQLARRVRADGAVETVAARDIAPGDRLLLASGDRVPVTARLEEGATEADVSLVTGESLPAEITAGMKLEAGTVIVGQGVTLLALARADQSLVADLARLLEAGRQRRSLYVRLADRAAKLYVPGIIILAMVVFAGWMAAGADFAHATTYAIAVLIITCPCALGLAVPAVQVVATGRLFARGLLVKSGDALERLAEIDTVIFDKTGTLTRGSLTLNNREALPPGVLERAARLARASQHPLARALTAEAGMGPVAVGVREVTGAGLEVEEGGSLRRLGSAAWCGAAGGSGSELWYREGNAEPVHFDFRDGLRPDAPAMIAALRARGLRIEMLTGDNEGTAAAIAAEAGVDAWHARVGPAEKVARLEGLRAEGCKVLMVGDGLNDAAAMALAHVSIAPGNAAEVSQLASDMVLRSEQLIGVAEAYEVARKARRLVLENFALATLYNLVAIPLAATGLILPVIAAATMASSSLLVSLNSLRLARP
ncbi:MAG: copper-translocating P-type ATPase [Alphaproteobacteria bacterium 64-11]|nr:heavy metal translocating P-type ATPase [Alphaproteobacteria bacterium]OJU13528.1 MAG: copper-translocating P-type ATPase [Alphaproteobacteria bacterium 64-11]